MLLHEPTLPWRLHQHCQWLCGHCRAMGAYVRQQERRRG